MNSNNSTSTGVCLPIASDPNEFIDLSRGARLFGLSMDSLLLEGALLNDYSEMDPAVGYNVVGTILSVLGQQVRREGGVGDLVSVCVRRREDARPVEVELEVKRRRRFGRGCILLRRAKERVIELSPL